MRLARVLAAVLALLLCAGAQASERYVVNAGGVAALVDARGEALIGGADVSAVFEVRRGALYAAGAAGDYGLYDADGGYLAGPFEMIDAMDGALIFRRGGLYGAMDDAGKILIAPEWTQLAATGEGYLALNTSPLDEQPDEVLFLTPYGAATDTGVSVDGGLTPPSEGRMPFRAPDGRFGCLDAGGHPVVAAEWGWIGPFRDGAAIVSDGAVYGLIDRDGALIVPPKYLWLQRGDGLLAGLREDGALELLSPDGREVYGEIPAASGDVSLAGSWAAVRNADGVTLYDRRGAAVATLPEALIFPGLDGQVVVSEGAWGAACQYLMDPDGRLVGPFQRILPLTAGRYAFAEFGEDYTRARFGLMDAGGTVLLEAEYREIAPAGEDRLVLVDDEAVYFADADGNVLRSWAREGRQTIGGGR